MPGAAIALVQDGRLTLVEGFGVRDLATGAPTTADTVFQLASVSKTFTAATVAALVDRRTLAWEQPMVSLLPDFRLHDAYAGRWVNARDLLTHRAGFPAFFGDLFDHLGYGDADVLRRIRYVEPATSFRDRPAYSNIGFFLAGELAAKAGGQPFPELTRSLIFEPLTMGRTGVASTLIGDGTGPGTLTDVSRSHALVGERLQVVPPNLSALFIAAGGFDYSPGWGVLSEAAVKAMFEPVIAEEPGFAEFPPINADSGFDYSPGWGVYHYNGLKVLEKGGALDGVRTLLLVVPQKRFAVAILANRNLTAAPVRPTCSPRSAPRPADAKPPSRPLAAYTGTYINDLWGTWTVAEHNGSLEVLAGPARYRASLGPWNGDTFHLLWPRVLSAPVQVPFASDSAGRVSGFDYLGYGFRRVAP